MSKKNIWFLLVNHYYYDIILKNKLDLHPCAEFFKSENQDLQKLYDEGIKCILVLYGGPQGISLDEFRQIIYILNFDFFNIVHECNEL